jgi:tape measure domain-containing protein
MLGGEIKVVMTLDNGQFTIQTQKSGQVIKELKRTLEDTARSTKVLEQRFTGLYGRFQDLVKTASLLRYALHDIHDVFAALPGAILKSSGEIERMTLLMEGLSKQTDSAAKRAEALSNVKFVFDMAQKNPFDVKALTDSFVKFKSAGLDPTNGSLQALVDSVARFGGTSEALKRASIAIQQMAGKGVISMEELRQQLGEAVPNAINMMADGAGMSMAKFTKLVSTGTVEASTSLNNMFAIMKFQNDGAAAAMMQSWTGMLALLSTKFELFKKEVGDNAFFEESKKQLQDIIDLFGQPQAKAFANDLGESLAQIVRALRSVIETVVEWWGVIKLAGQAFLAYFAITKVQAMFNALRGVFMAKVGLYQTDVAAQRAALADKLNAANQEIAAERQRYAQKVATIAAIRDAELNAHANQAYDQEKAAKQKLTALQKERAEAFKHYQTLNQLHQQHLMQKMAAELAAEAAMRQKKAGSAAQARAYTAEANRLGGNAALIGAEVAKAREHSAALEAQRIALLRQIDAARMSTVANSQQAASAAAAAAHAREMARLLQVQAGAATAAASGVTLFGRAMSGLGVVFNAFGGWVGVAIGVLVTLGSKLYEYMNRWEEFRKAVDRTKRGMSSAEDMERFKKNAEESKGEIEALSRALKDFDALSTDQQRAFAFSMGSRTKPNAQGRQEGDAGEYRRRLQEGLNKQIAIYTEAQNGLAEQKRLIREEAIATESSQYQREYERGVMAQLRTFQEGVTRLTQEEQEALKKARDAAAAKGRKLTQGEEEALRKRYIDARNAIVQQEAQYRLTYALEKDKTLQSMIAVESDPKKLEVLKAQRDFVAQQIQAARERIVGTVNLGKTNTAVKDPKPKLREDPLVRMAADLEAAVIAARIKYEDVLDEGRTLKALKNQVAVEVFGDMAEGKFDSKEQNADGEMVPNFMGGKDARKLYAQNFIGFLELNKGGVEEFIATLDNLKDKEAILKRINDLFILRQYTEGTQAIEQARQIGIGAANDLKNASIDVADNGLSRESAALNAVIEQFNKLEAKVRASGKGYEEFQRIRDKAVGDATAAREIKVTAELKEANNKYIQDVKKGVEESRLARSKASMDFRQLARAQYEEELRLFQEKEDKQQAELTARMLNGSISWQFFESEKSRITAAGEAYRTEAMARWFENSKSAVAKLRDEWQNSVNAMNQATANWANSFMDRFINVITGGSFKWKEFVAGMARDLLGMLIKKELGGAVVKMFGGIGQKIGQSLGLVPEATSTRGQSPDQPMYVQDVSSGVGKAASEEGIFKTVKDKLTDTWEQLKSGLSNVWDSLKSGFDSVMGWLKDGMSWITEGLSSFFGSGGGGGDMLATIMSFFGFAKGGVMTGSGPMPLKRYAMGGIAKSPQLAMFGEGSTPEAYVPLPDGRSIPVSMSAAPVTNNGGTAVYITINVDENGQDQETSGSGDAETWKVMASRVKGVVMEELVKQQRPGGVLYK